MPARCRGTSRPSVADALEVAASRAPGGTKPAADSIGRDAKKNYAQVLSTQLALVPADPIRRAYPSARVTPLRDGRGQESAIGASLDRKKIDVGVWDDAAGMMLGVSIKTYTFRDASKRVGDTFTKIGRYTKNIVRNDHELRAEADVLHRRQRYAVLVAVMFLPRDACWDGSPPAGHSSFAHQVFMLRKRAGRTNPDHPRTDLFECVFIGLFDDETVDFFDDPTWTPPNDVAIPPDLANEPLTIDDAIGAEPDEQ